MLAPLIRRSRNNIGTRSRERGFTMALVAAAMVALVGMAALSIDLGTLYQAKAEAQRAADAAALAAARVISLSGITADPTDSDGSWSQICGGAGSPATLTAINAAQQNLIASVSVPPAAVTVGYGVGSAGGSATDCSTLSSAFAINPIVTVNVQRTNLPIFFARVFSLFPGVSYSGTSVSGTAVAEVFNPSDSGAGAGIPVPVQPRCVKPWIIPNTSPGGLTRRFVHRTSGKIWNEGIYQLNGSGIVGQALTLRSDCNPGSSGASSCSLAGPTSDNPPVWSGTTVEYIPALVVGAPGAVPSCGTSDVYQKAIAGCDQNTVYTCGTPSGTSGATQADLTENPIYPSGPTGDTSTAAQCLIHQSVGQDTLAGGATSPTFPFQMQAGLGSPLIAAGVAAGDNVSSSNSVVTIPIAEFFSSPLTSSQPPVSIVGFMQAFITSVDAATGNVNVVVLNISGCGDAATGSPVYGTSPVPIRLITPP